MSETTNDSGAPTAEPSVLARWLAFGSIVAAGVAGGFIGWAFMDLQCDGDCTVASGITGLITAVGAAVGVGIVAVLALRAIGEWQSQQATGINPEDSEMEPGLVLRKRERPRQAGTSRRTPRVR